jgi:hypothetical protein
LFVHALADYPLQGEFLANGKNRHTPLGKSIWIYCLPSHSMIHAGFVFLVTGNLVLGMGEFLAHLVIDFLKCERKISFRIDQVLHCFCKVIWAYLSIFYLGD